MWKVLVLTESYGWVEKLQTESYIRAYADAWWWHERGCTVRLQRTFYHVPRKEPDSNATVDPERGAEAR